MVELSSNIIIKKRYNDNPTTIFIIPSTELYSQLKLYYNSPEAVIRQSLLNYWYPLSKDSKFLLVEEEDFETKNKEKIKEIEN